MMALLLIGYTGHTQSLTYHNPAVADAQAELNDDNEYGQLSFTYKQELSGFTSGVRHTVKMTVCLLNVRPTNGVQSIEGEIAEKFDWQYDETVNCFLATQSGKLLMNQSGEIFIDVVQNTQFTCDEGVSKMGFNVNIQPAACMNGVNDLNDDHVSAYSCVESRTTDTEDLDVVEFDVYPNPFLNEFVVELSREVKDLRVELYTVDAQRVAVYNYEDVSEIRVNSENLISGVYTAVISSGYYSSRHKLIKISK